MADIRLARQEIKFTWFSTMDSEEVTKELECPVCLLVPRCYSGYQIHCQKSTCRLYDIPLYVAGSPQYFYVLVDISYAWSAAQRFAFLWKECRKTRLIVVKTAAIDFSCFCTGFNKKMMHCSIRGVFCIFSKRWWNTRNPHCQCSSLVALTN